MGCFNSWSIFDDTPDTMNEDETHRTDPAEKLQASKSHALQAAEELRAAAGAKASQVRRAAENEALHLRELAEDQAAQLREAANQQWAEARVRAEDLRAELEHYVRQNPTKAILTTFGIGLFIGMMLRR